MTGSDEHVRQELRALLQQVAVDVDARWGQLEARISRARRRRHATVAIGGLAVVALVSLLTVRLNRDDGGQEGRVATEAPTSTTQESPSTTAPPEPSPGATIEELSQGGLPATVFATNVNGGAIAVSDLEGGVSAVYPPGTHPFNNFLGGAVFTASDELVTANTGMPTFVHSAGRPAEDGQHDLVADGLSEPGREIHAFTGERTVLPTDNGDAVWILQFRNPNDQSDVLLDLVDLETGEVQQSVPVAPLSRLVDVAGDRAVIHADALEPGGEVALVSPAGETTTVEAPEEAAVFAAATSTHTVWIADGGPDPAGGDRVLVVGDDGETTAIPTPYDELSTAGHATTTDASPLSPALTTDGTRLLLQGTDPSDADVNEDGYALVNRLVVVDLSQGTVEAVHEDPGFATAFWGHDDRTIIIVDGEPGQRQTIIAVDTATSSRTTVDDALPDGFFVVTGR